MSRNEEPLPGHVPTIIKNGWAPYMGTVDSLIEKERTYIDNLRYSEAMHEPITLKRQDKGYIVWDGHHRLAAHHMAGRQFIKMRWES
jgi:hypothetical protein